MLRLSLAFLILGLCAPASVWAEEGGFFDREALMEKSQEAKDDFSDVDEDDFFGLDEERLRKKREVEAEQAEKDPNQQEFLKVLNKIRGKDEDEAKRGNDLWGEFEDVSGQKAEKTYLNSKEVEVWRELRKPVPRKRAFGNKIDDLEEAVNSLKTPNYSGSKQE